MSNHDDDKGAPDDAAFAYNLAAIRLRTNNTSLTVLSAIAERIRGLEAAQAIGVLSQVCAHLALGYGLAEWARKGSREAAAKYFDDIAFDAEVDANEIDVMLALGAEMWGDDDE